MKKYKINTRVITQSMNLQIENLNSIMFINTSAIDTVKINTYPIAPGGSIIFDANELEIDTTIYIIELPNVADPNTFYVITKTYL